MERAVVKHYIQAVENLGAKVVETQTTGKGHYKFVVSAKGRTRFFIGSNSSSDVRNVKNFAGDVRRWIRTIQG